MYDLLITGGTLVTPGFVVAGNCGVGLDWNWRSFPEYMGRLGERAYSTDIGTRIPHAPVRVFVMGERALNHEPR